MLLTSAVDVIEVVVFGALGFLVVVIVCVALLAILQLILPSTDAGAEAVASAFEEPAPPAEAVPSDGAATPEEPGAGPLGSNSATGEP
ncbi:MAG: hypothetical protein ACYDAC_02155 [Candidatus Dormibacteria bacterium]